MIECQAEEASLLLFKKPNRLRLEKINTSNSSTLQFAARALSNNNNSGTSSDQVYNVKYRKMNNFNFENVDAVRNYRLRYKLFYHLPQSVEAGDIRVALRKRYEPDFYKLCIEVNNNNQQLDSTTQGKIEEVEMILEVKSATIKQ